MINQLDYKHNSDFFEKHFSSPRSEFFRGIGDPDKKPYLHARYLKKALLVVSRNISFRLSGCFFDFWTGGHFGVTFAEIFLPFFELVGLWGLNFLKFLKLQILEYSNPLIHDKGKWHFSWNLRSRGWKWRFISTVRTYLNVADRNSLKFTITYNH